MDVSRAELRAADDADSLGCLRARFDLPEGLIYLDGNSLGPPVRGSAKRVVEALERWRIELIGGWNGGWLDLPMRLGDRLAPLLGVAPGSVVVADSISVNLAKILGGLLESTERKVLLATDASFPSDLYVAAAVAERAGARLVTVPRASLASQLSDEVAVLLVDHVDFRSGERVDLRELAAACKEHGALLVADLAHSAGWCALELESWGVDAAVGCTYKYLNGGPGAPAFAWLSDRLEAFRSAIPGWLGHAEPFAFDSQWRPASGVRQLLAGTPPILSMAALEPALELFEDLDMRQLEARSLELGEVLIELADSRLSSFGLEVVTPRDAQRRGSHVALRHPEAVELARALAARGVTPDARRPDILRFGFSPLYTTREELWRAVEITAEILESGELETTAATGPVT